MTLVVRQDGAGNYIGGPFMMATHGVQAFGKEIMAGFLAAANATLLPTPGGSAERAHARIAHAQKAVDLNSVDCDVVCGVVTPAVRDQGLAAGSAGRSANAAPAVTVARALATPTPTLPAVDWADVSVPISAPTAKRARGSGNKLRRSQIVRTELREFFDDCKKHHPGKHTRPARLHAPAHSKHVSARPNRNDPRLVIAEMVIDLPSADLKRAGTRPAWWPEDIVFEVLGHLGSITDMQRIRAILQQQYVYAICR